MKIRALHLSRAKLDERYPGQADEIVNVCELLDIPVFIHDDRMTRDEPQGMTHQCPKCGAVLDIVKEHAFMELYECARCGYEKKVKQ